MNRGRRLKRAKAEGGATGQTKVKGGQNEMAFIPLPNGIRVATEFELDGQLVVNVYHFTRSSPIVSANLTAIAELMVEWWADTMSANFSASIALVRVVATDVSIADGEQIIETVSPPEPGQSADEALPNNVAFCISKRTVFTGRSFMGRNYFAGLGINQIVGSYWGVPAVAALLTDFDTMMDDALTAGFTLVIASYESELEPRVTALATPVTTIAADTRADSQRRRLPGVGI